MKLKILALLLTIFLLGCDELLDIEATSMTIKKVTLEKMSFFDGNGISWDDLSNPDIFIQFEETNVNGNVKTSVAQDISISDLPVSWTLSPSFSLNDFNNNLKVTLFDEDVFTDDIITSGEFIFDPNSDTEIFILTIDEANELTIEVSYEY